MRRLMTILAVIACVYIVICLLAYLFQYQLMHFPDRKLMATPAAVGMAYSGVFFETEDAVRLHGWFIPSDNARAVVLFCHGNAGNISHRLDSIRIFLDMNLSVFIFDYRSYGRSDGRISEDGIYADARAARRYLVDELNIEPGNIVYFGRSLGGAVAIELATHHQPFALIVESGFTSMLDLGARVYPWLPVKILCRIRYDSTARVAELECPKLFIHSREDDIVPFALGKRLYEIASEPKELLEISGSHNDGFLTSGEIYIEGLRRFFDSLDR